MEKVKYIMEDENRILGIMRIAAIIALIAILIPMVHISFYNCMSTDDFQYGRYASEAWHSTHSVIALIGGQMRHVKQLYMNWEGKFSAEFICAGLLGVFGDDMYYMCNIAIFLSLIIPVFVLTRELICNELGGDRAASDFISVCMLSLLFMCIPYAQEAFYWLVGGGTYTIFFGGELLLLALLAKQMRLSVAQKKKMNPALTAVVLLLEIIMGGGSYIGCTMALLFNALFIAYSFMRRNAYRLTISINFAFFTLAFLINMLSPGNVIRLGEEPGGNGFVPAIFISLKEAFIYTFKTINPIYITMGLVLAPVFVLVYRNSRFDFRFPVPVSILIFLIYAAHFAPAYYAIGGPGPERMRDMYRFAYTFFVYAEEFYILGAVFRYIKQKSIFHSAGAWKRKGLLLLGYETAAVLMLLAALALYGGRTLTPVSAAISLRNNEAHMFYDEWNEMRGILENDEIRNAELRNFSVQPYLLYNKEFSAFGDYMADYYGKDSVTIR
ncbi:MAG: hypothetical protein IJ608_12725 [Lachnospiraceae bacterium]|nr:hypothetical protein [Lachnospiraceae bacterium]